MRSANSTTCVSVEVFVEKNEVAEMGAGSELVAAIVDSPLLILALEEYTG